MKGFEIVSKSLNGENALRRNLAEYHQQPWHVRTMLDGIFTRIISEDPLSLKLVIKNNFVAQTLSPQDFTTRLKESMNNEGVEEKIDYEVIILE